jgi:anti-sigma factor (TIGR02949 family)
MDQKHNCRDLLGSLCDYVDGELSAELMREIEQHLSTCPDCRVVVDTTKKTISLVHTEERAADCPEEVKGRLFKTLNLEEYLKPKA